MRKLACILVGLAALVLSTTPALAQDDAGRSNSAFGLGAQSFLRGPGGVAGTFDIGLLHIDAILFLIDVEGGGLFGGDDSIGFGARMFYSVHQTDAADLGVGGGVGFIHRSVPGDDDSIISIEMGAKIRAFIVSNVALTAFLGAAVIVDDDDEGGDEGGLLLGGQQVGFSTIGLASGFGFTYYFH